MNFISGKSPGRLLILHGGAPPRQIDPARIAAATQALTKYAQECFDLLAGGEVCDVVVAALTAMEADPQFNAGLGSSIQGDGQVRVSAGLMDGTPQTFSGVINALDIKHPSLIARALQGRRARVVSQPGVQSLARELNLPIENLITDASLKDFNERVAKGDVDTVGCVARNQAGQLAAGTSTGGRGNELPGRVSDSATVAGNYATAIMAVSTTGVGEEIVDDALAARLETRCRDGLSLEAAARRCYEEALARSRSYGWTAVHRDGSWAAAHTTPSMSFVVRGETGVVASSAIEANS